MILGSELQEDGGAMSQKEGVSNLSVNMGSDLCRPRNVRARLFVVPPLFTCVLLPELYLKASEWIRIRNNGGQDTLG